jgi:adenine-specific DNA-methyltransferase
MPAFTLPIETPSQAASAVFDSRVWPRTRTSAKWTRRVGTDNLGADAHTVRDLESPHARQANLIQIWCPPEGTVLDPFAGSGTTGHAVLALNETIGSTRRFVLIEQGRPEKGDSYARTLTADRLNRVVNGGWHNGKGVALPGGFEFRHLTKNIDAPALLQMEREEMIDTVVASYFNSARRRGPNLERVDPGYAYLVAQNADGEGFYLVWDGPGNNTDFTEDVYEACVVEGEKAGLRLG